jgi:heme oxygenase
MTVTKDSLPEMSTKTEHSPRHGAPDSTWSLREELREATRADHDEIENRMDLMRADYTIEDYGRLLQRYHAFYEFFEAFVFERVNNASRVADFYFRDRRKAPWLASDLDALGLERPTVTDTGLADALRAGYSDEARLLGAIYVIEGSMLGGAVLAKQFQRRLDLALDSGLKFFTGYGAATKSRWLALQELLSEYDDDPSARGQAVEGARSMFRLFGDQLTLR